MKSPKQSLSYVCHILSQFLGLTETLPTILSIIVALPFSHFHKPVNTLYTC